MEGDQKWRVTEKRGFSITRVLDNQCRFISLWGVLVHRQVDWKKMDGGSWLFWKRDVYLLY